MRNWIVGGVLAAGLVSGHPAAAFDGPTFAVNKYAFGGACTV